MIVIKHSGMTLKLANLLFRTPQLSLYHSCVRQKQAQFQFNATVRQRRFFQKTQLLCQISSTLMMNPLTTYFEKRHYSTTYITNCLKARTMSLEKLPLIFQQRNTAMIALFCYEETNEFLSANVQTQYSLFTSADLPETFDRATQTESSLLYP